jgi:hypothetical protein
MLSPFVQRVRKGAVLETQPESSNGNYVKVAGRTPELTGAAHNAETAQVLDESRANSASGRMSCDAAIRINAEDLC